MVLTKSEHVAKQDLYSEENSVFGRVSYYLLREGVRWGGRLLTFSVFSMGANLRLKRLFE